MVNVTLTTPEIPTRKATSFSCAMACKATRALRLVATIPSL